VLFVRDRDASREVWDGARAGPDGATRSYGANDAFPITDIDEILPGLLENRSRVYYTMGVHHDFDQRVVGWVNTLRAQARQGVQTAHEFVALDHLLHDMRLYKSRPEFETLRRAAQIAARAHVRAMRSCRPGLMEYQVEAELLHEFRRHNAETSYLPIVGSGRNTCVLHYRNNSAELKDGDLLLIDAGCEFDYYASDITRTFPVNGRYSPEQRAIYELVLLAQAAALTRIRPGNHWNDPHDAAVRTITQGLVKLGLLKGKVPALIRSQAYKQFFMHRTGHWLGMDVHDVGDYKVGGEWRVLEPGMAMTVEPGIYIPAGSKGVPRRWWNIGVRIEDDVVVTRGAPDVLTRQLPKDPDEIERLMQAA
jgi:Xaa-Pro aminopeptidase